MTCGTITLAIVPQSGAPRRRPPCLSRKRNRSRAISILRRAAKIRPIVDIAAGYGISNERIDHFGRYKAKVRLEFLKDIADLPQARQVRRRDRYNADPLGRGQDDDDRRPRAGTRPSRPQGHRGDPPAFHGTDLRHQGRGSRRRLQPDRADGRLQPASHRGTSTPYRRRTTSAPRRSTRACITRAAGPTPTSRSSACASSTWIPTKSGGGAPWT